MKINTKEMNRTEIVTLLNELYQMGCRVHHFNGSQWYIKITEELVLIADTSRETDEPELRLGSDAKRYLESNSNMGYELDDKGRQISFNEQLAYFDKYIKVTF